MLNHRCTVARRRTGFTLIELLVVIGVLALLMGMLMPSLNSAMNMARAIKCATNLSAAAKMVQIYGGNSRGNVIPPSYVYPLADGTWGTTNGSQDPNNDNPSNGYLHWSYLVAGGAPASNKNFECPSFKNNGCPRTNPGPNSADREPEQVNTSNLTDRQAPRMAYTANAGLMPRNKFTEELSGSPAHMNKLVCLDNVNKVGGTVLLTEFNSNWKTAAVGAPPVSKSHRPLTVFEGVSSGSDVYGQPPYSGGDDRVYQYCTQQLKSDSQVKDPNLVGLIDEAGASVVGRQHPGSGSDDFSGTANFAYGDGHVDRHTIKESLSAREWGDKFYSLTGQNGVK